METVKRPLTAFISHACKLAAATLVALGLTALLGMAIPVFAMPFHGSTVMDPGDPQNDKCKPHRGQGLNPHCPPPVVPEAPMAILLPLSAAALLGAGYVVLRKRTPVASA